MTVSEFSGYDAYILELSFSPDGTRYIVSTNLMHCINLLIYLITEKMDTNLRISMTDRSSEANLNIAELYFMPNLPSHQTSRSETNLSIETSSSHLLQW